MHGWTGEGERWWGTEEGKRGRDRLNQCRWLNLAGQSKQLEEGKTGMEGQERALVIGGQVVDDQYLMEVDKTEKRFRTQG